MIRLFERSRRVRLLLAILVTASLVVVTVDYRTEGDGPLDALGRYAMTVLGPIQEGLARIARPVGNFFAGFTEVPSLKARIAELERLNAELRAERDQIQDVFRENEQLRRLLGLERRLDLQTMPARVIGLGPSNFEQVLFVDRGSSDGVRRGMPVVGGQGLVGRVLAVGASTAQVLLITDRSSAVAGRLAGTGETGLLQGTGGSNLRFELLNPEAAVASGDLVVTSGYDGGVYPPGVPVGAVTAIREQQGALSRVVTVRPFVDFTTLDYLLLVTGFSPAPRPSPTQEAP